MIDFRKNSKSLWASWFAVIVFFIVFIGFPLFCVLGAAKPADFQKVFSSNIWHEAMKNTLFECVCSSLLSVFIGYVFAFAVVKANLPFKKFFAFMPVIHLMTPPFVGGLSFILLLGRRGFITYKLLGLNISLYGFWGLLIAQTLCFFPMAYLICLQSLLGINPNLEKAAKSMGAGYGRIFLTITLPLSFSGILGALLFVAVNVLSDFGNPLIVAGRFRVLAVEIYTQLTGWLNVGTSAVLGIVLVIPSVLLFLIQNGMMKRSMKKGAAFGGKDGGFLPKLFQRITANQKDSEKSVSLFANILLFIFVLFISACVIAQFSSIVAGSFQKLWGINTEFTLEHIKSLERYILGLKNSIGFALIAAVMSTIVALFSSYMVHRTNVPLRKTIDSIAQLPSAIPGSLLGLSLSIAATKLHFRVSSVLIVMAMTVSFMPFSYRVISQSLIGVKTTLDDAARSLGANPVKTLFSVLLPSIEKGVYCGFMYDFIRGAGTLSSVIFLVSFKTPLASINIVNLAEQGDWGKSAALAMVLTLLTFLILGVSYGIVEIRKHIVRLR